MAALDSLLEAGACTPPPLTRTDRPALWPVHDGDLVERLAHDVELVQHDGPKMHPDEIEDLLTQARPGMKRRVFRIVHNPIETEDLTQTASIKVFTKIDRLHDPRKFLGWSATIAARTALKWVVSQKHHTQSLRSKFDDGEVDVEDFGPAKELDAILHEERVQTVYRVLTSLKESDSALLARFYLEDASLQELTHELGIPLNTVKTRLFAARGRFKSIYESLLRSG